MKLQKMEKSEIIISREELLRLKGGSNGEYPSLSECTGCDLTGGQFFDCQDGDYVID